MKNFVFPVLLSVLSLSLVRPVLAQCPLDVPQVQQVDIEGWRNKNQAQFNIVNRQPGVTYTVTNVQWANPTVQPGSTRSSFIVKGGYGHSGDYYGYFTITASNGFCEDVTSEEIPVEYRIGFTPGARGIAASGNPADASWQAYPNPATEQLTLPEGSTRIRVLDNAGRVVQEVNAASQLDVRQLANGLYNLQLWYDGQQRNQRIQVQH